MPVQMGLVIRYELTNTLMSNAHKKHALKMLTMGILQLALTVKIGEGVCL